jgi:beta-barrel assembly-enhancing protease
MQYENPIIPEGINTSNEHPLKEFLILSSGILLILLMLISLILFFVESMAESIPFEFEQKLAAGLSEQYTKNSGPIQQYLQVLADKIAKAQELPPDMSITVHYIDDGTMNAFATLGGHVIIFKGLLEKLPNENALVLLLGHEIAHIKHRHPIKKLSSGLILQIFWAMINDYSDTSSLLNVSHLSSLTYSRANETEADEDGLHSVYQIYQDVNGATELFQVLQEQAAGKLVPEYLSSHPDIQKRIKHLQVLAEKRDWPAKLIPTPSQINL